MCGKPSLRRRRLRLMKRRRIKLDMLLDYIGFAQAERLQFVADCNMVACEVLAADTLGDAGQIGLASSQKLGHRGAHSVANGASCAPFTSPEARDVDLALMETEQLLRPHVKGLASPALDVPSAEKRCSLPQLETPNRHCVVTFDADAQGDCAFAQHSNTAACTSHPVTAASVPSADADGIHSPPHAYQHPHITRADGDVRHGGKCTEAASPRAAAIRTSDDPATTARRRVLLRIDGMTDAIANALLAWLRERSSSRGVAENLALLQELTRAEVVAILASVADRDAAEHTYDVAAADVLLARITERLGVIIRTSTAASPAPHLTSAILATAPVASAATVTYAYKEVVRGRDARASLRGFDCDYCAAFYAAVTERCATRVRACLDDIEAVASATATAPGTLAVAIPRPPPLPQAYLAAAAEAAAAALRDGGNASAAAAAVLAKHSAAGTSAGSSFPAFLRRNPCTHNTSGEAGSGGDRGTRAGIGRPVMPATLPPDAAAALKNAASRHRSRFALESTPEGFWCVEDSQVRLDVDDVGVDRQ